jgi:hypothetical protein
MDRTKMAGLLADQRWRWLPGMRARTWSGDRSWFRIEDGTAHTGNMEPDLDDDSTRGCLLRLVRDAWGPGFRITVIIEEDGGALITIINLKRGVPYTFLGALGVALVAALVAARAQLAAE